MIRVVLADDEELVRTGLRLILRSEPDLDVVGEAGNGVEALELVRALAPDVVLLDIRMPVLDGLEATRQIQAAALDVRVVILTTFDSDEYVYEALRSGASGFLLKDAPATQLVGAIRAAAAGDAVLAPTVTRRVVEALLRHGATATPVVPGDLTKREAEVLSLMARGMSNSEIADLLVITEGTVKTHVARILMKLGVRDRLQAVVVAYQAGFAQPSD